MPPKSKRAKANSSRTFDKNRFVSEAASIRYNEYKWKRTAIPERGLDIAGPINEQIEQRKWHKLVAQPEPAIASLVTEFYANAAEAGVKDSVFVRGKQVSFSSSSINKFYGLLDEGDYDDFKTNHVDWKDVIEDLCESETSWNYYVQSGEVSSFPSKCLHRNAKIWFYFIAAKLMPVSHSSSVHRNRATLLFAIENDISINVGEVIHESIRYSIDDESLAFVCPCLISSLCKEAGVTWSDNELLLPTKGVLNSHTWLSLKPGQQGSEGHEDNEGPSLPPPKEPLGKKLQRVEKLLHEHRQEFISFQSDVHSFMQDHSNRLEELFEYQRQSNEVIHHLVSQTSGQQGRSPSSLPQLPPFPHKDDVPHDGSP